MANLQQRLKAQTLLASQITRVTANAVESGVSNDDVINILSEIINDIRTSLASEVRHGE